MVQCSFTAKSGGPNDVKAFKLESIPLRLEEDLGSQKQNESLRIYTIGLCVLSVILNLVLCVLAVVFAAMRQSPATFAFAADCVLDLLSSSVVIWRYFGSPYTLYSNSRENKACISLGGLFILAGVGVIIEGTMFLYVQDKPTWFLELLILAGCGFIACVFLGTAKIYLWKKIASKALFLDALNSYLSALFALVIIISDIVYYNDNTVWFLDPILSIVFSVGLLAYGLQIIFTHCRSTDTASECS